MFPFFQNERFFSFTSLSRLLLKLTYLEYLLIIRNGAELIAFACNTLKEAVKEQYGLGHMLQRFQKRFIGHQFKWVILDNFLVKTVVIDLGWPYLSS